MFYLLVSEISSKGFAFLTTFYLARTLQPENWSVIVYSKALYAPFVVLVTAGFDLLGMREISRNHSATSSYVNSLLTIRILLSIISYAAYGIIALSTASNNVEFLVLMIMGLIIFGNATLINWVYQGIEQMHIIALRSFLINFLNFIFAITFVRHSDDLIITAIILSGSFLLNNAWMIYHYNTKISIYKPDFDFKRMIKLIKQAVPIGLAFLITSLYNNLDVMMLKWLRTSLETGMYGVAHTVIILVMIPSTIIQGAFFPRLSRLKDRQEKINSTEKQSRLLLLAGSFTVALVFVYADIAVKILGEKYSGTDEIIQYLMLTGFIIYISLTYYIPLLAWGFEKKILYANITGIIINLLLNLLLIPDYGYYGAIAATIFSEFGVMLYSMMIFYKHVGTLHLRNLFSFSLIGFAAGLLSYSLRYLEFDILISLPAGIIFFVFLNFLFKTISIDELKTLFKRKA